MAPFALATQILLNITEIGNQTDRRFRLMHVELISNKEPGLLRISLAITSSRFISARLY